MFTTGTRSTRGLHGENPSCFSPRSLRVLRGFVVNIGLALSLMPAMGTILDRIAVSVGSQVITLRDVEREIRVAAFLDAVKPDMSAANKRAAAERLVDQTLIRQEMQSGHFPFPPAAEVAPELEKLRASFPTQADYQRALAEYGIAEPDAQDLLLRLAAIQEFISLRFRPGVQVTDQDIQDYFDRVVAPAARAAHPGEPVKLDDYRTRIEDKLAGERADQELDTWLKEARKRTQVVFHPEAFE